MSSISQVRGNGGLEKVVVDHPAAEGEIYLHGAHVTHWKPAGAEPVIYLSPNAVFAEGKAIRGGVPICLPWFGPLAAAKDAPAHGLVRTKTWELVGVDESELGVSVRLRTDVAEGDSPHWSAPFTAEFAVTFGRTLTMTLRVTNTGQAPMRFEEALHAYYRVHDVRQIGVGGLNGATYLDKVAGMARKSETAEAVTFGGEVDRVYVDTTADCVINDPHLGRQTVVEKDGSRSTVVWNPAEAKAAAQADLGAANWPHFVCVESANVGEDAVTIEPGDTHALHVHVRLEPVENA